MRAYDYYACACIAARNIHLLISHCGLSSTPSISLLASQLNIDTKPRSWYVACSVYNQRTSTECQIVLFGGNVHVVENTGDRMDIADLRILTFGRSKLGVFFCVFFFCSKVCI